MMNLFKLFLVIFSVLLLMNEKVLSQTKELKLTESDLVIKEMILEKEKIFVTVTNDGLSTISNSTHKLTLCYGDYCVNKTFLTPFGKESYQAIFSIYDFFITRGGSGYFKAYVDSTFVVQETNESNNQMFNYFYWQAPMYLPDLMVTDIIQENGNVLIKVLNVGKISAGPSFEINFRIHENGLNLNKTFTSPSRILPGQTVDFKISATELDLNQIFLYSIFINFDPNNLIQENDETNNYFSKTIQSAYNLADLRGAGIAIRDGMIYWGIYNQGDVEARNFNYYVEINNKIIGGEVLVVSPNHVSMFGTNLLNLGIIPGQRVNFKLVIDPEQRILELNRRNNTTEMVLDY